MIIDRMQFVVKQEFVESKHSIAGKSGNLFMEIDLRNLSDLLLQVNSG